jgi:hypothetical protein
LRHLQAGAAGTGTAPGHADQVAHGQRAWACAGDLQRGQPAPPVVRP